MCYINDMMMVVHMKIIFGRTVLFSGFLETISLFTPVCYINGVRSGEDYIWQNGLLET